MSKISKLSKREKIILFAGIFVIVAATLHYAVLRPVMSRYHQSAKNLAAARDRLNWARQWRDEIRLERQGQDALQELIKARSPQFNLWSYVNDACRGANVNDRAEVAKKRSFLSSGNLDEVELNLNGVSMEELVRLLYNVSEKSNLVFVYEMGYLRPSSSGKGLDCSLTLISPKA